jgi:RNA polymerase sigma-70 factor (ECF subfamily)
MIQAAEAAGELRQLQTSAEQAVVHLFDRYRSKLERMVLLRLDARIVGKVDVEDILQDVFVEAARRVRDFLDQPAVPFFVWLRQITGQILIDMHRRYLGAQMRDVSREVSLDRWGAESTSSAFPVAQLADSLTSPSQCAARNEEVARLRVALQNLSERDREVLILRHLEQLSNNDVAEILGIDKYAASKRYVRALERLRSAMSVDQHGSCDPHRPNTFTS